MGLSQGGVHGAAKLPVGAACSKLQNAFVDHEHDLTCLSGLQL